MQNSKLSDHTYVKGKFITPFNKIMKELSREESWFHGRLPEYIWLGLILKYYGRDEGLVKCCHLLQAFREHTSSTFLPRFSDILNLSENDQKNLYNLFADFIEVKVMAPLTVIFTYSRYPCFSSFFASQRSPEDRTAVINDIVNEASDHQSEFSTDIRFLVLYCQLLTGRLHMPQETLEMLLEYPTLPHSAKKMRMIRPTVRAMELSIPLEMDESKEEYSDIFWEGISKLSSCELFSLNISPDHNDTEKYIAAIKHILQYYTDILVAARPLDNKLLVILGIATYSYKRILEVVEHDLYQTIVGRSIVRILIENYIVLKYLIKNESEHDDIWTEYQYYGIGQYKLIAERYREAGRELPKSHVMYDYIDLLVGEYKNKEFIDMDTTYFDKTNVREKAIAVGEKELFGLYYDYDSAYEHGLWGAIRESALIKCNSAAHQYHCVPDIDNVQKMKDIWDDCVGVMNKIIDVLKDVYGLPSSFDEVK
ncbi:MAG TPA: hypothetical protein DCG34_05175 [Clostridiales bacterium]|nr:hypothetical protein [Clostridiales bacterium]